MNKKRGALLLVALWSFLSAMTVSGASADSFGSSESYRYMEQHRAKKYARKRVKVMQRYFCAKNPRLSSRNALRYAALTERNCRHYKVDPFLVAAIIVKESTVRRTARSCCSYGLMQINWDANKSWIRKKFRTVHGPGSLLHSGPNIKVGTYMMKSALERTGGNVDRALDIYRGKSHPAYRGRICRYYADMVSLFKEFYR